MASVLKSHSTFKDISNLISPFLEYPDSKPARYPYIRAPSNLSPTPLINHIEKLAAIEIPLVRRGSLGETRDGIQWNWKVLNGWWAWEAQFGFSTSNLTQSIKSSPNTHDTKANEQQIQKQQLSEDEEWFRDFDAKVRALEDMVQTARIWLEDKECAPIGSAGKVSEFVVQRTDQKALHQTGEQLQTVLEMSTPMSYSRLPTAPAPPSTSNREEQTWIEPSFQSVETPRENLRLPTAPTAPTPPSINNRAQQTWIDPSFQDVETPIQDHHLPAAPTPPSTNPVHRQPLLWRQPTVEEEGEESDCSSAVTLTEELRGNESYFRPDNNWQMANESRESWDEDSDDSNLSGFEELPQQRTNYSRWMNINIPDDTATSSEFEVNPPGTPGINVKFSPKRSSPKRSSPSNATPASKTSPHGNNTGIRGSPNVTQQRAEQRLQPSFPASSPQPGLGSCVEPSFRSSPPVVSSLPSERPRGGTLSEVEVSIAQESTPNRSSPKGNVHSTRSDWNDSTPLRDRTPSPSLDRFPELPSPEQHVPVYRPNRVDEDVLRSISSMQAPLVSNVEVSPQLPHRLQIGMLSIIEEEEEPTDSYHLRLNKSTGRPQNDTSGGGLSPNRPDISGLRSSSSRDSSLFAPHAGATAANVSLNGTGISSIMLPTMVPSPSSAQRQRTRTHPTATPSFPDSTFTDDPTHPRTQRSITPPTPTPIRKIPLPPPAAPILNPSITQTSTNHLSTHTPAAAAKFHNHPDHHDDSYEDLWEEQAQLHSPVSMCGFLNVDLELSKVTEHSTPKSKSTPSQQSQTIPKTPTTTGSSSKRLFQSGPRSAGASRIPARS